MPWAEPGSQFTALFEALAIDWLQQASVSAVAKHLRIRGTRRPASSRARSSAGSPVARRCRPGTWGVDETSFQKRHEYVTVVSNLERAQVLHVADDRTIASLDAFWTSLAHAPRIAIEAVAMDMYAPYIRMCICDHGGRSQRSYRLIAMLWCV